MERKYFKCYLCETGNSYTVPKNQKGKECRCCLAYNYFFKKNHKKYKKDKNENNTNRKKYYKKNNNHNNSHNNVNNNNNNNGGTSNHQPNNTLNRNQINSVIPPIQSGNNFSSLINFLNNNVSRNLLISGPASLRSEYIIYNPLPLNQKKEKKKNEYSWLKKEKLTEELMNKKKEGYECSICLENIKINEDINILKCGHIFHYKCIEELLDHNDNKCPNCRSDLKTGEKQKERQDNHLNLINELYINEEFYFDDDIGNLYDFQENDYYDDFDEYL